MTNTPEATEFERQQADCRKDGTSFSRDPERCADERHIFGVRGTCIQPYCPKLKQRDTGGEDVAFPCQQVKCLLGGAKVRTQNGKRITECPVPSGPVYCDGSYCPATPTPPPAEQPTLYSGACKHGVTLDRKCEECAAERDTLKARVQELEKQREVDGEELSELHEEIADLKQELAIALTDAKRKPEDAGECEGCLRLETGMIEIAKERDFYKEESVQASQEIADLKQQLSTQEATTEHWQKEAANLGRELAEVTAQLDVLTPAGPEPVGYKDIVDMLNDAVVDLKEALRVVKEENAQLKEQCDMFEAEARGDDL